jgi:hypothetical protein
MTAAGTTVELKRYRIPDGERALKALCIEGRTRGHRRPRR